VKPPLRVVLVGSIANAPVESIAGPISIIAMAIVAVRTPIFLLVSDIFPRVTGYN
jgi:hypothetical protein